MTYDAIVTWADYEDDVKKGCIEEDLAPISNHLGGKDNEENDIDNYNFNSTS